MITLTRLNNRPFTVNSDLIKFIEQSPDTVITLLNGEKVLVLESAEEVRNRVVEFRRAVLHGMYLLPHSISAESSSSSSSSSTSSSAVRLATEAPESQAGR
jgi:flagellar protein FlbD